MKHAFIEHDDLYTLQALCLALQMSAATSRPAES